MQRRYHRRGAGGGSVLHVTAAGRNEDTRGLLRNGRPASGQCSRYFFPFIVGFNHRERISNRATVQFSAAKIQKSPPHSRSLTLYTATFSPPNCACSKCSAVSSRRSLKIFIMARQFITGPVGRAGRNKPAQGQVESQRQERFGAADSARGAFCVHVLVFPEAGKKKSTEDFGKKIAAPKSNEGHLKKKKTHIDFAIR